jgi:hypothetical protein
MRIWLGLLLSVAVAVAGDFIQVNYFQDNYCYRNYYSVGQLCRLFFSDFLLGIKSKTCVQSHDHSLELFCSSSQLSAKKYASMDCSGSFSTLTISTAIDTCTKFDWYSNPYLETPRYDSYSITCSADKNVSMLLSLNLKSGSGSRRTGYLLLLEAPMFSRATLRSIIGMRSVTVLNANQRRLCSMRTHPQLVLRNLLGHRSSSFPLSVLRSDSPVSSLNSCVQIAVVYSSLDPSCFAIQSTGYLDLLTCIKCSTFRSPDYFSNDDFWDDDFGSDDTLPTFVIISIVFSVCFFCICLFGIPVFFGFLWCRSQRTVPGAVSHNPPTDSGIQRVSPQPLPSYAEAYPVHGRFETNSPSAPPVLATCLNTFPQQSSAPQYGALPPRVGRLLLPTLSSLP